MPDINSPQLEQLANVLRQRVIDDSGPGSVLRDFETLLAFVGEEGVRSAGKYRLLPMARLNELDQCMTHPLRPRLKRPQQKSFPHINGLYLLLRATEIGVPQGKGKATGRLVLDPVMYRQWQALNPTERYFNLLEAWLRHGRFEMVGLRGGGWLSHMPLRVRELWSTVPPDGLYLSGEHQHYQYSYQTVEAQTMLALIELFGLMEIRRSPPQEGQGWVIAEVHRIPYGDALLRLIFDRITAELFRGHAEEEEEADEREPSSAFGAWQRILQPYFPEWQKNLELPEPEFRDGTYYFKVSLGEPWRKIAIPAGCDLDDLAHAIIGAFDFDGDHLYGFQLTARDGRRLSVECPYVNEGELFTDELAIGALPLAERDSMRFLYDYGASWLFDVKLEQVDAAKPQLKEPKVVESNGEAPPEYDFGS